MFLTEHLIVIKDAGIRELIFPKAIISLLKSLLACSSVSYQLSDCWISFFIYDFFKTINRYPSFLMNYYAEPSDPEWTRRPAQFFILMQKEMYYVLHDVQAGWSGRKGSKRTWRDWRWDAMRTCDCIAHRYSSTNILLRQKKKNPRASPLCVPFCPIRARYTLNYGYEDTQSSFSTNLGKILNQISLFSSEISVLGVVESTRRWQWWCS